MSLLLRRHTRFLPGMLFCCMILPAVAQKKAPAFTRSQFINADFSITRNGAASWSMPVAVPPGTNNVEPSLSIVYTSGSPDGLLGAGFSLQGFSRISRIGATRAQDGFTGGVDYSSNDRFSMDGNRLMLVQGGSYGAAGTVYHTEQESWTKVTAAAQSGSGPQSFQVQTKNGGIFEYGVTTDSRVLAAGTGFNSGSLAGSVREWLADKYTDPNGNVITITYTQTPPDTTSQPINICAGAGQSYPLRIDYTANSNGAPAMRSVQFTYEQRPDSAYSFMGGGGFSTRVRLNGIRTYVKTKNGDSVLVRTIAITYKQSALGISEVAGIYVNGKDCGLLPTSFTWSEGQNNLLPSVPWSVSMGSSGQVGDFNGDGKNDILQSNGYISLGSDSGFTVNKYAGVELVSGQNNFVGDYNGDGLSDVLTLGTSSGYIYYFDPSRDSFATHISVSGFEIPSDCYPSLCVWQGDFNGDGKADIASALGNTCYINLSNGNGFNPAIVQTDMPVNSGGTFAADFNGDGLTDLFTATPDTGYLSLGRFSDSNGFRQPVKITGMSFKSTNGYLWIGDYNGDGLADVLSQGTDGNYHLYYATGAGFAPGFTVDINLNSVSIWPGDFNNDGNMDLYAANNSTGIIYLSNGLGFSNQESVNVSFAPQYTWMGDFNGDGVPDIYNTFYQAIWYGGDTAAPHSRYNQQGTLITGIDNGAGGQTQIAYQPITDSTIYYTGNQETGTVDGRRMLNGYSGFPLSAIQDPGTNTLAIQQALYVATAYSQTDGTGDSYKYGYRYGGARYDTTGRGFLGYAMVSHTDTGMGSVSHTFYRMAFPFTGCTDSSLLTDFNNVPYQGASWRWDSASATPVAGSRIWLVQQKLSNAWSYAYGQLSNQGITQYWYDNFGNCRLKQLTGNTSAPQNTIWTGSSYINDSQQWRLGQLTAAWQAPDSSGTTPLSSVRISYDGHMNIDSVQKWNNTDNSWLLQAYGYDVYGNQVYKTSYDGDSSFVQYDSAYHSFPVRSTSPLNTQGVRLQTTTVFDPLYGNQVIYTDANGNRSASVYDGLGRLRQSWIPDSSGHLFAMQQLNYIAGPGNIGYTAQQVINRSWKGNVRDTTWQYMDAMGRPYQTFMHGWNGQTVVSNFSYGSSGQLLSGTLPYFSGASQVWYHANYDVAGRVVRKSLPFQNGDSSITTFSYGPKKVNVVIASGTADSIAALYAYDYYNGSPRITACQNAAGTSNFSWDLMGRPLQILDPQGIPTAASWNSLGLNNSYYSPSFDTTFFFYNPVQDRTAMVNGLNDTIAYSYDHLGRTLSVKATGMAPIQYTYDLPNYKNAQGQLCTVTQDNGATTYAYAYDRNGNMCRSTTTMDGKTWAQAAVYNPDASMAAIVFPDSSQELFRYNAAGQATAIQRKTGIAAPTNVVTVNGINAMDGWLSYAYANNVTTQKTYYTSGALSGISVNSGSNTALYSKTFSWKKSNIISGITDLLDAQRNELYTYTPTGRLSTTSIAANRDTFGYDASGNLLLKDSIQFTYSNYQAVAGTTGSRQVYSALYNACGNMLSRIITDNAGTSNYRYSYNGFGQLDSVFRNDTLQYLFTYDFTGNRNRTKDVVANAMTYQVSADYVVESAPKGITGLAAYSLGGNVFATYSRQNKSVFYSYNQNNSTVVTTNTAGKPFTSVQYDAYGNAVTQDSAGHSVAPYRFNGKEWDDRSGLYYFSSRYYDPVTGRFASPDDQLGGSLATADALNNYAFALNSPVTLSDPSGHSGTEGTLVAVTEKTTEEVVKATEIIADGATDGTVIPLEIAANRVIKNLVTDVTNVATQAVTDEVVNTTGTNVAAETEEIPQKSTGKRGRNKFDGEKESAKEAPVLKKNPPRGASAAQKAPGFFSGTDDELSNLSDDAFKASVNKGRPGFRKGVVETVWSTAKKAGNGMVICPNSDKTLTFWDPVKKMRAWDMGHRTGYEYKHLLKAFNDNVISRAEFLNEYNNPAHYYPEDRKTNQSHEFESKTKSLYNFSKKTSFIYRIPWYKKSYYQQHDAPVISPWAKKQVNNTYTYSNTCIGLSSAAYQPAGAQNDAMHLRIRA